MCAQRAFGEKAKRTYFIEKEGNLLNFTHRIFFLGPTGGGNSANGGSKCPPRRNSVLRRNDERRERNILRLQRTIKLLCWIGAIFCLCWLPLNLVRKLKLKFNHSS